MADIVGLPRIGSEDDDGASDRFRRAIAWLDELGVKPITRCNLFFGLAAVLDDQGKTSAALESAERAAAIAEQTPMLRAHSLEALRKRPGRTEYQRGVVSTALDGRLQVRSTGTNAITDRSASCHDAQLRSRHIGTGSA